MDDLRIKNAIKKIEVHIKPSKIDCLHDIYTNDINPIKSGIKSYKIFSIIIA